jgi:hypothetical protein
MMSSIVKHAVVAAVLVGASTAAQASSPAAWVELYAKAGAACAKSSGLTGAKPRRETADFQGVVLLIVDGRHPNGMRGTAYCLYDKVTAKTETTSAQVSEVAAAPKPAQASGRTCWTEGYAAPMKTPRPIGAACRATDSDGESYFGVVRR